MSLCLYDETTLYFEAENEEELRNVGYSKERRVDPQIVVGLLVCRAGFPLEIGCYEGNPAETSTIIPIVKAFQARHHLVDMVVVADARREDPVPLAPFSNGTVGSIVARAAHHPAPAAPTKSTTTTTPNRTL